MAIYGVITSPKKSPKANPSRACKTHGKDSSQPLDLFVHLTFHRQPYEIIRRGVEPALATALSTLRSAILEHVSDMELSTNYSREMRLTLSCRLSHGRAPDTSYRKKQGS